jgi:hypothetical protein
MEFAMLMQAFCIQMRKTADNLFFYWKVNFKMLLHKFNRFNNGQERISLTTSGAASICN